MRYENVNTVEELNFRVSNYIRSGYKVVVRDNNYANLVKDDFSWGIFILLLLFLIIGALIYWAVKSGNKDEVIIQVGNAYGRPNVEYNQDNTATQTQNESPSQAPAKDLKCPSCDHVNDKDSKFCFKCGTELNSITDSSDMVPEELSENKNECINCGNTLPANAKFCTSCGASQTE